MKMTSPGRSIPGAIGPTALLLLAGAALISPPALAQEPEEPAIQEPNPNATDDPTSAPAEEPERAADEEPEAPAEPGPEAPGPADEGSESPPGPGAPEPSADEEPEAPGTVESPGEGSEPPAPPLETQVASPSPSLPRSTRADAPHIQDLWPRDRAFSGARLPVPAAPDDRFSGTFDRAPALQWRAELPGGPLNSATHSERSRPVILGPDLLVGSAKGSGLYRLSRANGAVLQRYPAEAAVQGEALVLDDRVYFADIEGTAYSYTLDGELLWTWNGTAPILVRPTYSDGRIYITNVDDLAMALDAETGELIWRYQARRDLLREAELRLYAAPPAVVLGDVVVLGFSDGSLVGVDGATGDERWARQIGEGRYPDIVAEPVPWGEDLYASAYFEPFVSMDTENQAVRWRADVGGAFGAVIDARDERTTVYHPGSDGELRAFSALTGAARWAWDSGTSGAVTSPVITEAGLVVGSSAGLLYLVDPIDGTTRWTFSEPYRLVGISTPPVVDGRQLLFVTNAGFLYSMVAPEQPAPRASLWPDHRARGLW